MTDTDMTDTDMTDTDMDKTDHGLIRELAAAIHLPEDALRRAVADPEAITVPVLILLYRAADAGIEEGTEPLNAPESNLLFWGLHALSAIGESRIYDPLMRLLRRGDEVVSSVLGEDYQITLSGILASTFDGDADRLLAAIAADIPDGLTRMELFHTLALLTADGDIDRETARAFLVRFDAERLGGPDEEVWQGWEDAVALLGFDDLVPRLKAARKDGRNTGNFVDWETVQDTMQEARLRPKSRARFANLNIDYIGDPVAALEHTREGADDHLPALDEDGLPIPERNPYRDVGRNDPCPCGSGKKFKKCCLDKVEQGLPALPPLPRGR